MKHPTCNKCRAKATRWDGGEVVYVITKGRRVQTGSVVYLCDKHDPHSKAYTLPTTLESAILDIVALREKLQEEAARRIARR